MRKQAFVTGGGGFLGRHLIQALIEADWAVSTLVRQALPPWLRHPQVRVHHGDLTDARALSQALPQGCDAVFHLAGALSMWTGDRALVMRDNVQATQTLLDVARARGAARFIMTSTLGVFRPQQTPIDETAPLRDARRERNPYLASKLLADEALQAAAAAGLRTVAMHPAHLLGPGDQRGWVTLFDDAARGKLTAAPVGQASFAGAAEVARAHVAAAEHPSPAPRYVLGGAGASYRDLFQAIASRVGAAPVRSTVPPAVMKTLATLQQWASHLTRRTPALTPGLADILCGDLVTDARLAAADLQFRAQPLDTLLDATFEDWAGRSPSGERATASAA